MHAEWYAVPASTVEAIDRARAAGGRVIAVGTTVARSLESAGCADAARRAAAIPRCSFVRDFASA